MIKEPDSTKTHQRRKQYNKGKMCFILAYVSVSLENILLSQTLSLCSKCISYVLLHQSTSQRDQSTSIAHTHAQSVGAASRCAPTCRSTSIYIFLTPVSNVPPASVTSPARASYAYIDSVRQVKRSTVATCVSILPWSGTQSAATLSAYMPMRRGATLTVTAIRAPPVVKAFARAGRLKLT